MRDTDGSRLLSTFYDMESRCPTSLLLGSREDVYVDSAGSAVVVYSENSSRRPPRTSMDFVLENADPRLVAAFRDTTRQLACRGSLVFPGVVARIKEAARVEAAASDDQRPRGGAGIVGVVRVDSPQTLKLVASRDQDEVNLETVMDARFILVDGAGRPRRLSDAQLAAATEEIVATMLAYYAVLLARHHRIVRSARASAALAVEADDADRESPAVPSRIWLPGPA